MVRKMPPGFTSVTAELPTELNYEAEMKTTRIGPKKWVISIPIVLSEKYKMSGAEQKARKDLADPWRVKEAALHYNATSRIKTLAQPKWQIIKPPKPSKGGEPILSNVSPQALKYMPTKRILQLARPKDIVHEIVTMRT